MIASSRKDEALERLSNGIAQLTNSDAWSTCLRMQGRFHQYSFANTVLILVQQPGASRVAGFHTWRRFGRMVRRGEHAIWILAPVTRRAGGAVPDAQSDEPQKTTRVVATFRPVPVFDVTQTEGEPLPEICTRLTGEDPSGAFYALAGFARDIGFQVLDHAFGGEINGDCSQTLHRIRLEIALQPAHRVKTLAHELAHALLHFDVTDRALKELEAESVAFIVCDAIGIRADDWTFGYVASWSSGGEEAIAAIKSAGARIQRTADRILAVLECESVSAREADGNEES